MAKKFTDQELMQYFDGELPADEQDELAAELLEGTQIPSRDDAQLKLRSLEQLRDTVRTYLDLEADRAGPKLEGLWARVEQGIKADATARKEVAPAAPVRAGRAPTADPPSHGRGLWGSFNGWLDRYRSNVITSLVTAGAVAALFLAFSPARQGSRQAEPSATAEPARPSMPSVARSMPPMIESLEVEDGSAAILNLPAEGGDTATAVIWVTRDQARAGSPI